MRRLVLIAIMLLPLWWSWSAAARICAHPFCAEKVAQLAGQHAVADDPASDASPADEALPAHADCHSCHGVGAACPVSVAMTTPWWPPSERLPAYGRFAPEPPAEDLLRPPMTSVA